VEREELISRIRGKLVSVDSGKLELRCGFITYEVLIPGYLEKDLQNELDQVLELFVLEFLENTQSNQSIPRLIGFGSELEREFFEQLLRVPGMGIRTALKAMQIPPEKMAEIIASQNASMLAELPGLGKKSAERIISELKNQVERFLTEKPSAARVTLGNEELTAIEVLINLGLRRGEAEALVRKAKSKGISTSEELVQDALRERGRKTAEVRR